MFSATVQVYIHPPNNGQRKALCSFCVTLHTGQNLNSLKELPFVYSLSIPSLQLSTKCNFLVATDPLLSFAGCIQWLGYVPTLQFNNMSTLWIACLHKSQSHSSIFILSGRFQKLVACRIRKTLNGNQSDHHGQVSPHFNTQAHLRANTYSSVYTLNQSWTAKRGLKSGQRRIV